MRQLLLDLRKTDSGEHWSKLSQCLFDSDESRVIVVRSRVPLSAPLAKLSQEWRSYPLVDGPSAFYVALCPRGEAPPVLDSYRDEHRRLIELYPAMVRSALEGRVGTEEFVQLMSSHLNREEEELFALVERWTGEPRLARELGYDHQGLRAGLAKLPDFVERVARGETTKKARDAFEIEFFHLFEHHYEREELSLYPLLERLAWARGHEF